MLISIPDRNGKESTTWKLISVCIDTVRVQTKNSYFWNLCMWLRHAIKIGRNIKAVIVLTVHVYTEISDHWVNFKNEQSMQPIHIKNHWTFLILTSETIPRLIFKAEKLNWPGISLEKYANMKFLDAQFKT